MEMAFGLLVLFTLCLTGLARRRTSAAWTLQEGTAVEVLDLLLTLLLRNKSALATPMIGM